MDNKSKALDIAVELTSGALAGGSLNTEPSAVVEYLYSMRDCVYKKLEEENPTPDYSKYD